MRTSGPNGGDPVADALRGHPVPGGDLLLPVGRGTFEAVVVQHGPDAVQSERSEDAVSQLGDQLSGRQSRKGSAVAHM